MGRHWAQIQVRMGSQTTAPSESQALVLWLDSMTAIPERLVACQAPTMLLAMWTVELKYQSFEKAHDMDTVALIFMSYKTVSFRKRISAAAIEPHW